jgi:hypothetical protein
MGKWMRYAAPFALLALLAASAARGQQQLGMTNDNVLDTHNFSGISFTPDTKAAAQSGSQSASTTPAVPAGQTVPVAKPFVHKFWDKENIWLFAGVGAARGLDFASTLNMRRRGVNEVFLTNAIVDNHPEFAAIEVGATAASIGLSYIFHATNHHRMERWTSYVHIGVTVAGAGRNYLLKTVHAEPVTTP